MPIAFGASLGTATGTSPDNSWDITTTAAVPAGGMVVVGVGYFNTTNSITVSGGSLTWTTHPLTSVSQRVTGFATAVAPAGLASGSTITVTVPSGSFACGAGACYVTGADTLDISGTGSGSTQAWSASLTTLTAATIVLGFGWVDGLASSTATPAGGYTEWCDFPNGPDVNGFQGVYQVVASTGTYTPGGTWVSGTNPWVATAIALKSSGAPPAVLDSAAHWRLRPPGRISPAGTSTPWVGASDGLPPQPLFVAVDPAALNLAGVTPTAVVPVPDWFTTVGGSTPQLLVSSEEWFLLCNGTVNNAGNPHQTFVDYFTARQAQGYNAVEVTMFSYPDPSAITSSGQDSDGVWPFASSSNNPSNAFNSTWTARRDDFFSVAATYGFRVICNITTPYLSVGAFTASWTDTQWTDWGTKIGTQWGSVANVMWIVGDDYFNEKDTQLSLLLTAMRSAGANQPVSIQNHQERTSRTDIWDGSAYTWGRNNADFDWVYTYNPPYDGIEKAGLDNATLDPIPYVWGDGYFLNSSATGLTDKQLMRRMVWWALSSGAKGVNIGNNTVYPWDTTAALTQVQTNTFYTAVMPAIVTAFTGLTNWQLLKADTSSVLVTAGRGTHVSPRVSGGSGGQYLDDSDSYVTASWIQTGSHAGELAVIYMSHGSTITIDQTKMVAGYTATWIDPANGATSSATVGSTYNSTAKGNNSDGQADWVLVLRAATNQSVAVDPATLTLTGQTPGASGTGAASVAVDAAALALTGIDPTGAGTGASSTTVDVAALTLTGQTPGAAGTGAASQAVDVAALTLTGVDPASAGTGASSTAVDPAVLTLTGVDVSVTGGPVSVAVDFATLTLTGVDPTGAGTGAASQAADVAVLTLTGVDPTGAGTGAATQAVDVAILSLTGIDVTGSTGAVGTGATIDVATLTLVGVDPTAAGTGAAAVLVDAATLTLTGVTPVGAGTGVRSVLVDTAVLTLTGVNVLASPFIPDPNPVTATVRTTGHRATVRALNARTTVRSDSSATVKENRNQT